MALGPTENPQEGRGAHSETERPDVKMKTHLLGLTLKVRQLYLQFPTVYTSRSALYIYIYIYIYIYMAVYG